MAEQECVGYRPWTALRRRRAAAQVPRRVPCAVCQYESQQKDTKTVDRTENRKVSVSASLIAGRTRREPEASRG